jgi:hypothetical protein
VAPAVFAAGAPAINSPTLPGSAYGSALVKSLPQQSLNNGLATDVQARGSLVEFPQHALRQIHIYPANRLYDGESIGKEPRNIFPASGHLGNFVGGGRGFRFPRQISCASSRLTPCFRFTSRFLSASN